MNCEPEVIRARFVEAAATERFLPSARKPLAKGYWPEFFYDEEDRAGWDQQVRDDQLLIWQGRGTAKADALSRYSECLDWTVDFIDEKRPLTIKMARILWDWAHCRAHGLDFGARCVKRGLARPTAYRRLTAIVEAFCAKFAMEGFVVRLPAEQWLRHETDNRLHKEGRQENCTSAPAIKFTPGFQTEKSRDLLTSPEAIADFVKHRDMVNAERRGLQEREAKRRAKIGAMAS